MRKYVFFSILICFLLSASQSQAFFWEKYVIKINDQEYKKEDIKKWWQFWKEPNMTFPENPEPFIEWILLSDSLTKPKEWGSTKNPPIRGNFALSLKCAH